MAQTKPGLLGPGYDPMATLNGSSSTGGGLFDNSDAMQQLMMSLALMGDSLTPRVNPTPTTELIAPMMQLWGQQAQRKQLQQISQNGMDLIKKGPPGGNLAALFGGDEPTVPIPGAPAAANPAPGPGGLFAPPSAGAQPLSSGGAISNSGAGERVASVLRARGWSDAAIEGALNNSITESSLNPTATGAAGEKGLFQLHPKSHIGPFTQAYGGDWSPEAQANYIADTVDRSMPSYKLASDGRSATADFMLGFERPKDQSNSAIAARTANADVSRAILQRLGNGAPGQPNVHLASATPQTMNDASPTPTSPLLVGDSLAGHMITFGGGAGATDRKTVGQYKPGLTAVNGFTPSQILDTVIPGIPDEQVRGRNVILSTGASNDPTQLGAIPKQIEALKQRGASGVTLVGVGTAPQLQGVNDALSQIASATGATFSGPLRAVGADGIHSSDPRGELAAVRAAVQPQGTPAAAAPTMQDVAKANAAVQTPPPPNPQQVTGPTSKQAAALRYFDYYSRVAAAFAPLGDAGKGIVDYAHSQRDLVKDFITKEQEKRLDAKWGGVIEYNKRAAVLPLVGPEASAKSQGDITGKLISMGLDQNSPAGQAAARNMQTDNRTDLQKALSAAQQYPPGSPERRLAETAAVKAAGIQPLVGGERPGVPARIYNPATGQFDMAFQTPHLPEGAVQNQDGSVSLAPNAAQVAATMTGANARATQQAALEREQAMARFNVDPNAIGPSGATGIPGAPSQAPIYGPGVTEPAKTDRGTVIPPITEASPIVGSPDYLKDRQSGKGGWSDIENQWNGALSSNKMAEQRALAIADALKKFQSGEYAGNLAEIRAKLKAVNINLPESIAGDPAEAQKILKNNFGAVLEQLKTFSARPTQMEVQIASQNFANPNLQPEANLSIIAQSVGALRWENSLLHDWAQAKRYGWRDPQDFQRAWAEHNPIQSFVENAEKEIGPLKGMAPTAAPGAQPTQQPIAPPKKAYTKQQYDQLAPGESYLGPDGKTRVKGGQ